MSSSRVWPSMIGLGHLCSQFCILLISKSCCFATVDIACRALIRVYACSRCGTVSVFAGKRKVKALKLLTSNTERQNTILKLDQEWDLSANPMDKLEAFKCLLLYTQSFSNKSQ